MKKIILILALFIFYGCGSQKGYIFEIYQNGIKIEEQCGNRESSFASEGAYYKKTNIPCKLKGCGCFGSSDSEEKVESSGDNDIEKDFENNN